MEKDTNFPPAALGCLWEAAGTREAEREVISKVTVVFSLASDYFSAYLGEYRNVLSALEALNSAVLAAMDKTKLVRMGLWWWSRRVHNRSCGDLSCLLSV